MNHTNEGSIQHSPFLLRDDIPQSIHRGVNDEAGLHDPSAELEIPFASLSICMYVLCTKLLLRHRSNGILEVATDPVEPVMRKPALFYQETLNI